MLDPQTSVTPERVMQFTFGYAPSLIVQAALHHRVFDMLQETAKTVEQVSEDTGASVRGLRAIMNTLVALELLSKDELQRYSLTPESSTFLVSTKPSFLGGLLHHTIHGILPQWMQLPEIVQTGKPALALNQETMGANYFESFVPSLFPMMYPTAKALAGVLQLSQLQQSETILDLAAGSGVWGIALAEASPQILVTAIDWAEVIPVTQRIVAQHGMGDRFQFLAGDLLTVEFGKDHRIATLGHILHSEGEKRSRQLLTKVFAALAPGGTIAIAEWLPNSDRRGPLNALIFAVNMLVLSEEGDTFSADEIGSWLQEVGFIDTQTVNVPAPFPPNSRDKARITNRKRSMLIMEINTASNIYAIDHVQLAMPEGQEDLARAFYISVLGFSEFPKPAHLSQRGGLWLASGTVKLHLGIDRDFHPAQKAHPGLLVHELEELVARCVAAGYPIVMDELLENHIRAYVFDPFGNRIELLERVTNGQT